MATQTDIITSKGPLRFNEIPSELFRNMLEFKLASLWETTVVDSGKIFTEFRGEFGSIDFRFRVRTNSSRDVEEMRWLIDSNNLFDMW